MNNGIFIKPSRRTYKVSGYKCFDIYDNDMKKIPMKECDVIDIRIENVDFTYVSLEIVDGMIHIWGNDIDLEPLINTFVIKVGKRK